MEDGKRRGISLSPKSMVDNIADWPLHRVVEHLRKKEKENKAGMDGDCRMSCRSGSVRFFDSITGELATSYGVTKGRMCRWLSYHGVAIARDDTLVRQLSTVYADARRIAVENDSPDVMDIVNNRIPYSPVERDGGRLTFYVYASWATAEFAELAQICGTTPVQVAQIFMIRSVLTSDAMPLSGAAERLQRESDRWDKWMRYRLGTTGVVVGVWGTV